MDIERKSLGLLPPAPGLCPYCAVDHEPSEAHNQQSLYWQLWFQEKHGRSPTWADAIAHCDEEKQSLWRKYLSDLYRSGAIELKSLGFEPE